MEHDFELGKPWPIGTPDEVREAGLSVKTRHTCAKPDRLNGIKGCTEWDTCQFNMPRRGGFKGVGPKYVGYRLVTDRAENNQAKQDFCSCFVFVETIQNRIISAQHNKDEGRDYERIKIIAQEGEKMSVERSLPVNFRNEVTGPFLHSQPAIADALERAGFKFNKNDTSPTTDQKNFVYEIVVPKFPRPNEMSNLTFQAGIIADELQSKRDEDEREMRLWEMEQKEKADEDIAGDDDSTLEMSTPSLAEKPARARHQG